MLIILWPFFSYLQKIVKGRPVGTECAFGHLASAMCFRNRRRRSSGLPDRWGRCVHSCECDRKPLGQPCTSAKDLGALLGPSAHHKIPSWSRTSWLMSTQEPGVPGRWAMAVSACRPTTSNARWTCTAQFLASSPLQCQLCRTWTCRSLSSTWRSQLFRQ